MEKKKIFKAADLKAKKKKKMGRWFILISPGNNFSKTGLPLSNSNSMAAENILGRSLLVYL